MLEKYDIKKTAFDICITAVENPSYNSVVFQRSLNCTIYLLTFNMFKLKKQPE